MHHVRWIWTLVCLGLALAGALVYGLPDEGDYVGFGLFAAAVFFVVLLFIWLPGVIAFLAIGWFFRVCRRARA